MVTQAHAVYSAISDPTRRAILDALRRGERSAGDIAELFPVSRPAVSRHLRVLRNAGLLSERRDAQSRIYSLNAKPLREVEQWLQHYRVFWGAKLNDLKQYVESSEGRRGGKTGADR
jgi:DNA-binding transcriptional ArsR family regulator